MRSPLVSVARLTPRRPAVGPRCDKEGRFPVIVATRGPAILGAWKTSPPTVLGS
ncbi:hypothetical protein Rumeso_00799 [Rubellimicrobium mesophilum DSM 19309]|uniref:Uncharacterized protein n=1 Tax=Rubellimicrobium mesophilum DSM 19309 TaxID=442562 RepID=A0A017HU22_9RHOB|nr:hypothetical protein Rumeso_00799 [Rubellimicrobium mesophilum DSM 19309]